MNSLWLCLGTLTRIPVPMPSKVDARVAGWSLALSSLGAAVLAVCAVAPWWVADLADVSATPLLQAAVMVATVAWLTRGMHLDGLADTADGLGCGKPPEQALAIMKRSDIGPFGVVTLLLVLLVQVSALSQLLTQLGPTLGGAAFAVALVTSRAVLVLLGTSLYPAARPAGLGQSVASSVRAPQAVVGLALLAGVVAGILAWAGQDGLTARASTWIVASVPLGLLAGLVRAVTARDRFGGMTGDVYGAAIEVTFTAALVTAALGLTVA